MKALRFYAPGDVRLEDVPEPVAGPDEVKIRVRNCSTCGTDVKIRNNGHPNITRVTTMGHEIALLLVAMLSSKGAAGVSGAGFITLAATLAVVPEVPIAGMALILGVDRFMSECRSLTNFTGNAVATVVISRWENAVDMDRLHAVLDGKYVPDPSYELTANPA